MPVCSAGPDGGQGGRRRGKWALGMLGQRVRVHGLDEVKRTDLGRALAGSCSGAMCDVFFSPLARTVARSEGDAVGVEGEALSLESAHGTGGELIFRV